MANTESEDEAAESGRASQTLAVSAEAFAADPRVRDRVFAALDDRLTEVALWGDGWPLGVNRGMIRAPHVLSAAAQKFKSYARGGRDPLRPGRTHRDAAV